MRNGMRLSMLGRDYEYGFMPVSGGYVRANGKGYVSPLSGPGDDLDVAVNIWKGAYPGEKPSGPSDPRLVYIANKYVVSATDLYNKLNPASRIEEFSQTTQNILDAVTTNALSIAEAIAKIRASGAPPEEQKAAVGKLQLQAAMPWLIGGGALLVGMLLLAGTSRRRTAPSYAPGRGAYRY